VILAAEVVSPSSMARDVDELDSATGSYAVTGIFHDRVKLTVPFPIDLELGELTR
jgi:hypothetical protein